MHNGCPQMNSTRSKLCARARLKLQIDVAAKTLPMERNLVKLSLRRLKRFLSFDLFSRHCEKSIPSKCHEHLLRMTESSHRHPSR